MLSLAILEALERIELKLDCLLRQGAKFMKEIDDLQAQVTEQTTVEQSAITLIKGLADQITASAGDRGKLTDISARLHASAEALAAAITANTPAASPATPPPATPAATS